MTCPCSVVDITPASGARNPRSNRGKGVHSSATKPFQRIMYSINTGLSPDRCKWSIENGGFDGSVEFINCIGQSGCAIPARPTPTKSAPSFMANPTSSFVHIFPVVMIGILPARRSLNHLVCVCSLPSMDCLF